jgi:RNA polymerase sigma-70 factor (ECF subfamily)
MNDSSDEYLLEQLKNGNTKSLGVLYERYKTLLFNYYLRCTRDYDTSNDLLMETFERIYKYCHSYKHLKKVRPWIFQIASNLLKDTYKKSNQFDSIDGSDLELKIVSLHQPADSNFRNKQLHEALARLKPSQRNIVNMYYLLEMSYEDIASNENISINNARIKVCRALKKLKELLKDSEL